MAFYDVMKYVNEAAPMGAVTSVSLNVGDESKATSKAFCKKHGIEEDRGCWYCGETSAHDLGVVLVKGVAEQHRESMTVCIRSCDVCREVLVSRARQATRLFYAGMVVGIGGLATLILVFGEAGKNVIRAIVVGFLMTIFAGTVLGCSLAWIAVKSHAAKARGLRSEREHPAVRKALADGWRTP